jgi:hypothetical protein
VLWGWVCFERDDPAVLIFSSVTSLFVYW